MKTAPDFGMQKHLDSIYDNEPRKLAMTARTPEEFFAWQRLARKELTEIGGLAGRTPPRNPEIEKLGEIDRGSYVEEKHALDCGEGVVAPMYVLKPKTDPPWGAVAVFHGHSPSVQYILGNYPDDESREGGLAKQGNYAQALAEAGFLAFVMEQRGFGERRSEPNYDAGPRDTCRHLALSYALKGRTLIGERAWDGMCMVSHILTREDVVPGFLGCTGNSGGGKTTLWLSVLDQRITHPVVGSHFSAWRNAQYMQSHCICSYMPRVLTLCEMGDVASLIAPRPLRFINGEQDAIYPVEGAREQFPTVQRAYELAGAPGACDLFIHPDGHRYDQAAAIEWFSRAGQ